MAPSIDELEAENEQLRRKVAQLEGEKQAGAESYKRQINLVRRAAVTRVRDGIKALPLCESDAKLIDTYLRDERRGSAQPE